jgi:TATA-binding protein-associated factor Taf7
MESNDKIEIQPAEDGKEEEDANNEVAVELINLSQMKRLYGLRIDDTVFLATLVDLPCIIEAMKTLDYYNFYKSQDAAQMLYVHPKKIEGFEDMPQSEIQSIIDGFVAPRDDPSFMEQLYERKSTKKSMDSGIFDKNESEVEGDELKEVSKSWDQMLRFRHGISPITKNIKNIRYKKKPEFDVEKVKNVETILKDLIDTGFADHVDEVLLEFDDDGKLDKKIEGNQKKPSDTRGNKEQYI